MIWEIIPNPGKIRTYTSGCPKNQNKCWYKIGSPPPLGSKKVVLKLRSVISIVRAPARTGKDNNNKIVVIKIDQQNKGIFSKLNNPLRIFIIVVIKLIEPKMEEAPAKCKEKIDKSTAGLGCPIILARGGYKVQPVPTPVLVLMASINSIKEDGNNQKLRLFLRGNDMSGAPIIKGNNQLPNPPIIKGIITKKIITKACPVTNPLYN